MIEVENEFLVKIVVMIACTSEVVKIREHPPFCREFSILFIEDRVVFDHAV